MRRFEQDLRNAISAPAYKLVALSVMCGMLMVAVCLAGEITIRSPEVEDQQFVFETMAWAETEDVWVFRVTSNERIPAGMDIVARCEGWSMIVPDEVFVRGDGLVMLLTYRKDQMGEGEACYYGLRFADAVELGR